MLLVETTDAVAWLTLHYPEKRNALTPELLEELDSILKQFSKKDEIRCVVITGSGEKMFSSGFDIAQIPSDQTSPGELKPPDIVLKAMETIKEFPYPTIAMINGHAFGAGFNLCACCDIRIAADDIKIGMTPARLGVAYHPEGIQQFVEAFGFARTKEIFYTAGIFQGNELLVKGIVNHLVPKPDLKAFTLDYAQKITQNAPLSLKGIKQMIAMFENDMALSPDNLGKADELMQRCFQSKDLKEGQTAFMEKRKPEFKGR